MDDLFDIFINTVVDQYDLQHSPNNHTRANIVNNDFQSIINNVYTLRRYLEERPSQQPSTLVGQDRHTPYDTLMGQSMTSNRNMDSWDNYSLGHSDDFFDIMSIYLRQQSTPNIFNIIDDFHDIYDIPFEFEDVKITLSEDEFNKLNRITITEKNKENFNNNCNICLDEFNVEDNIILLDCKHYFHVNCIEKWLMEQSTKCPVCRKSVKEDGMIHSV